MLFLHFFLLVEKAEAPYGFFYIEKNWLEILGLSL